MSEAIMNQVWNKPNSFIPNTTETNDLPPEILEEIDAHADTLSVPEQMKKLNMGVELANMGIGLEKATNEKMAAKNKEIAALYENVKLITGFLSAAENEMNTQQGDKINMHNHTQKIGQIKELLPDATKKLIKTDSTYNRKELLWLCSVFLRHKDTDIAPQIERKTKEQTDIYKNVEQIMPMIRDILKKWLDLQERMVGKQIPR
jgi:hypothetical protein